MIRFNLILIVALLCVMPGSCEKLDQEQSKTTADVSDKTQVDMEENDNASSQPEAQNNQDEQSDYSFLTENVPTTLSAENKTLLALSNSFAFRFASAVDRGMGTDSYFLSPMSLAFLLGMISEGTAGNTRNEICNALGYSDNDQQSIDEFCRNLIYLSRTASSGDELFDIANMLVVNKNYSLLEEYREGVKNYYDADTVNKDFVSEDVADYINTWASEHTNGLIDEVMDVVPSNSMAVILNALYFKAIWTHMFKENMTVSEDFTSASGSTRKEHMMHKKDIVHTIFYYKASDYTAVKLPYGDPESELPGNYAMTILLPDAGFTTEQIVRSFTDDTWDRLQRSFERKYVDIKIPRFKIDFAAQLNDYLKSMGITSIFSPLEADFSLMTHDSKLAISLIKQFASISVDENGTEAASVSVAKVEIIDSFERPQFVEFYADRPFLFAITEQTTGAILFMGCYR